MPRLRPHQAPTLPRALARALIVPTAAVAAMGATYAAGHALGVSGDPAVVVVTDPAAAAARDLFGQHECWTGAPPADLAGTIPPAALVTLPGAFMPTYGPEHVGAALDHVFGAHPTPGLIVHGFCR